LKKRRVLKGQNLNQNLGLGYFLVKAFWEKPGKKFGFYFGFLKNFPLTFQKFLKGANLREL